MQKSEFAHQVTLNQSTHDQLLIDDDHHSRFESHDESQRATNATLEVKHQRDGSTLEDDDRFSQATWTGFVEYRVLPKSEASVRWSNNGIMWISEGDGEDWQRVDYDLRSTIVYDNGTTTTSNREYRRDRLLSRVLARNTDQERESQQLRDSKWHLAWDDNGTTATKVTTVEYSSDMTGRWQGLQVADPYLETYAAAGGSVGTVTATGVKVGNGWAWSGVTGSIATGLTESTTSSRPGDGLMPAVNHSSTITTSETAAHTGTTRNVLSSTSNGGLTSQSTAGSYTNTVSTLGVEADVRVPGGTNAGTVLATSQVRGNWTTPTANQIGGQVQFGLRSVVPPQTGVTSTPLSADTSPAARPEPVTGDPPADSTPVTSGEAAGGVVGAGLHFIKSAGMIVLAADQAIHQSVTNVVADAAHTLKCEGNQCSTPVLIGHDDGDGVPNSSDYSHSSIAVNSATSPSLTAAFAGAIIGVVDDAIANRNQGIDDSPFLVVEQDGSINWEESNLTDELIERLKAEKSRNFWRLEMSTHEKVQDALLGIEVRHNGQTGQRHNHAGSRKMMEEVAGDQRQDFAEFRKYHQQNDPLVIDHFVSAINPLMDAAKFQSGHDLGGNGLSTDEILLAGVVTTAMVLSAPLDIPGANAADDVFEHVDEARDTQRCLNKSDEIIGEASGLANQVIQGTTTRKQTRMIREHLRDTTGTEIIFGSKKASDVNYYDPRTNTIHLRSGSRNQPRGMFFEEVQHAIDGSTVEDKIRLGNDRLH